MLENGMVGGYGYEESLLELKLIGHCHHRYCPEELHTGEGYEFDGFLYCSTSCIGEELIEEGAAVDLSA